MEAREVKYSFDTHFTPPRADEVNTENTTTKMIMSWHTSEHNSAGFDPVFWQVLSLGNHICMSWF